MGLINTAYVEKEAQEHPRWQAAREGLLGTVKSISIERFGEVFNRTGQNFRLQKQNPALIAAIKHGNRVLPAPSGYGIGASHNFYFSHMLNCLYDCRYCFLQGMFRSGHYVWFLNYESFLADIDAVIADHEGESCAFFSGYDCDSLALESVTGFASYFVPAFVKRPNAWLELRTKSVNIKPLLACDAAPNIITASSFTPQRFSREMEHGVPPVSSRLQALATLQSRGWPVGVRLDPLALYEGWQADYTELLDQMVEALDPSALHSISYGSFRLPRRMYQTLQRMYPDDMLLNVAMAEKGGMVAYPDAIETEAMAWLEAALAARFPADVFFPCQYDIAEATN